MNETMRSPSDNTNGITVGLAVGFNCGGFCGVKRRMNTCAAID